VRNKILAGLCGLMLISATLFVAGSAVAFDGEMMDDDIVWAEAPALTTGGMSILLMMPSILSAVKAGLNKMQQSVE